MYNEERRKKLVDVLSCLLNRLCECNDRFIMDDAHVTRFHALRTPSITIKYYLERISKYTICSEEVFTIALIYIDRLIKRNGNALVNSVTIHRLLITSIMLGAKFFDDHYYNNAHFGKVGGVSCMEMNLLEIEFLFLINFNLSVEIGMYETYTKRLMIFNQSVENFKEQNCNQGSEVKKVEYEASSQLKAQKDQQKLSQHVKSSVFNSVQANVTAHADNSEQSVVPSVAQKFRQYSVRRCADQPPKFLQTSETIPMKIR